MTTLDSIGGRGEIPRDEFTAYECAVCGFGITRPDERVHNGFGWVHATCLDDPWQQGGRP